MEKCEFVDWATFSPEKASAELPRLLEASESAVSAVESQPPMTFEGLIWRLDDATRNLWRMWGMVTHMNSVMNSDRWREVEEKFQPQMVAFALRVGQSRKLYDSMRFLIEGDRVANPVRRRILEKTLESAERAGVGLDGKDRERFNEISAELAALSMKFANAVIDATKAFAYEKGGKTYTIDDAAYPETMKNCADAEVRERLYRAHSSRASENSERIDRILKLRQELAELLGFADPAEMSIAVKCAPSVEAVLKMIDDLDGATVAKAKAEEIDCAPWDVAYRAERIREERYSYSETELKQYFELEDVLQGLFRIVKFLFGVDIEAIPNAERPSVWHEDVRVYRVLERGSTIAGFYFDPFVRSGLKQGGAWMNEFGNRCDRRGEKPMAVVVANFPKRDADGRCLLPFREVETLFHEFGHALQCMLTEVGEEGAAGISLVEWDAVEVASQFMENWCLDDRTGIAVPPELKRKVRAAKNYRAATACRRQLAFAQLDMRLHLRSRVESPDALKCAVFAHFGVPMIAEDRFLCSFTHIFAGGYAAGYYGYKWAEVMSADCFGAFEESGLDDDAAVREVGRRYRETILALGGSVSALEAFRRFRGREPKISALLRQQDLI